LLVLEQLNPEQVEVEIRLAEVSLKHDGRESGWNVELCDQERKPTLWHDHHSGKILAYVFGAYKDEVFLQLKAIRTFGISRFYTDGWEPMSAI